MAAKKNTTTKSTRSRTRKPTPAVPDITIRGRVSTVHLAAGQVVTVAHTAAITSLLEQGLVEKVD